MANAIQARRKTVLKPKAALNAATEEARREDVFRFYRDLGTSRTYALLLASAPRHLGELSMRTLTRWAKEGDWKARLEEFDRARNAAAIGNLDPKFDQIEAMLKAAHMVLIKALNASVDVVPTRPGEIKQLIDAARNAIVLCDRLLEKRTGGRDGDGTISKQMMFDELRKVDQRIRDVLAQESRAWRYATRCEAMLREHGIEPPAREPETITVEAEVVSSMPSADAQEGRTVQGKALLAPVVAENVAPSAPARSLTLSERLAMLREAK